ncbi:MAG TPA: hypothetical protein PK514_13570 [Spirochaetota bacterium]|nr:hypothetical protein [Spirochaetota bacterium]
MEKKKRILIITDSISIPRPGIPYEDTWIFHFKNEFSHCDIIDRPMRGATTARLVTEGGGGADLLEFYTPDIVIIQMGLEECAPRLFKKTGFEHFFMHSILPKRFLNRYISFIKKRRVRMPDCTEIDHSVTENNIRTYIERCRKHGTKIVYLKIHRACDYYRSKSPFVQQNISGFNNMLEHFAAVYDNVTLADPVKDFHDINRLCIDELHVNADGHFLYFSEISDIVRRMLT